MLICVVVLFLLCWGPRFIMELLMKMQFSWLYYEHVYVIRIILFLLPMVHAILNPVVYFIMSRNFRRSVVSKCEDCLCQRQLHHGSFEDLEMRNRRGRTPITTNTVVMSHHQNSTLRLKPTTTSHELVVVRSNGQLTVDLIEQSPAVSSS